MPWFLYRKEYQDTIVAGAVIGLLIVLISVAVSAVQAVKFNKAFDAGLINIPANEFVLGQAGNPYASDVALEAIPYGSYLGDHPRRFDITGCREFELDGEKLYAAAPSIANEITVSMPADSRGDVEICAPSGLKEVPVYLWVK